jgi:FkbM family methyltransferase
LHRFSVHSLLYKLYHSLPAGVHRWVDQWQRKGRVRAWLVLKGSNLIRTDALTHDVTVGRGQAAGLRLNAAGTSPSFAAGTAEPHVQEALHDSLTEGNVFYDVGANVGFFTIIAARLVGSSGKVFAFEPLPQHVAALKRNVELNEFRNIEILTTAVAALDGTGALQLHGKSEDSLRAKLETAGSLKGADELVPVKVVSIDSEIQRGLAPPDVVKIDVEGAELDVLTGMKETLQAHGPTVICELHGTNGEVLPFLRAIGYESRALDGSALTDSPTWAHLVAVPGADDSPS